MCSLRSWISEARIHGIVAGRSERRAGNTWPETGPLGSTGTAGRERWRGSGSPRGLVGRRGPGPTIVGSPSQCRTSRRRRARAVREDVLPCRVLVGRCHVVRHYVQHEPHTLTMQRRGELPEVLLTTNVGFDHAAVDHIVAVGAAVRPRTTGELHTCEIPSRSRYETRSLAALRGIHWRVGADKWLAVARRDVPRPGRSRDLRAG